MVPVPTTAETPADAEQALRRLLGHVSSGPPPRSFYHAVLECVAEAMGAPHAVLEVRLPGEIIEREQSSGTHRPEFWRRELHDHLTDTLSAGRPHARLFRSERLQRSAAFLGVPLLDAEGRGLGALAVVVSCRDAQEVREQLTFLHCTALVAAAYRESAPRASSDSQAASAGPSNAKLLERLAGFSSATELAFEITNKIRTRGSYAQVALARVQGSSLSLLSISGLDEYKRRSPQVLALQAAMKECLDLGAPLIDQPGNDDEAERHLLHEQWRKVAGGDSSVASIPVAVEGGQGAILSLRRVDGQRFSASELEEVRALVEPYVVGLPFVDRANRGLLPHATEALGRLLRTWRERHQWHRKALTALPVALLLFLAFGRLPYRVRVPCVLVPDAIHSVSAPFDGVLRSAAPVAGDLVKAGELLATFDTTQLELEHRELLSQLEIVTLRHRSALAGDDAVETALLAAERRQLEAQLDGVAREIERSAVRAPFDGIVLTGDLRKRIGDQVALGELLFRVSPSRDWKLELEVTEGHVVHLAPGQTGEFSSRARPEDSHELTVRRIPPSAEDRDGTPVYLAEADITFQVEWLLAGMEGTARIETGTRPAWWVFFHGPLDHLQRSFWL